MHVEKSLRDHARLKPAITLLDGKFAEIEKLINPTILPKLKAVPFWLNNDIRRGACYHPNAKWLAANDRMPEKCRCIELQNVNNFLDWSKTQPMMVLHELAHAYHHRVYGFKNEIITKAFQKAKASKSYDKVMHISGREKVHYAMNNEKEYFAECTEAYFGKNDFYPFNRADLKKHDPTGFAMIESVWEVNK